MLFRSFTRPVNFRKRYYRVLQAAGIETKGLHSLRHTFATMLFDAGVDVKTAAYLMGHSDIRVTMDIYTHLSQERRTASEGMLLTYLDALPKPQ